MIWFGWVYGKSTIVGYLIPNSGGPFHIDEQRQDAQLEPTYSSSVPIRNVAPEDPKALDDREGWRERVRDIHADSVTWWYDDEIYMIWFGWVLCHINHCRLFYAKSSLYIYIYIYIRKDLVWLGFREIIHRWLFNAKASLYIYVKYIWFGLIGFYGISTIVGYLMLNPLYDYILNIYGLVGFHGISTIVAYSIPNPLYTYTLNIYDLVWLGFMAYQPLLVI